MKKQDIFKKIDVQTKAVLQSLKDLAQKNIAKVKEVGLKETLLTMGTPDEKELLYAEVVKREKKEAKEATTRRTINKKNPVVETTITKSTTATKKTSNKSNLAKKHDDEKTTKAASKTKKTAQNESPIKSTKGSKKDAKIALYIKDIKKHYGEVDEAFVAIIVRNLGPSIYRENAEVVSCSDPKELDRVRRNFLMKKLDINDASKEVLDAAIQDVCKELKGVDRKYRATFYYALAKKFKKESTLS